MRAKDLMRKRVSTIHEDESVEDLMEVLVGEHIHGVPVVNSEGELVGVVTQQDIFFGSMTRNADDEERGPVRIKEIMTAPAVSATEETELVPLCRMMYKLRIHRVPIVVDGKVTGIVSSLDICGAIAKGQLGR
jgi:CBS domain-containing protein